ncbi:MAG: YcxB family protein [Deltaproteobacteria bacterium]|jgi:hypothetical protein|nr:YcxB family protein [Deltaproteobacteria bacterium]MCW9050604.1 YcxB family protein [Deltaproteobacteria bacterium]
MPQHFHIQHNLNETDWRQFYNAYYATDTRFKLRFIYGTITWVIGALGLAGLFANNIIAFGMIAFGLYCVFAKQFLINKALKKMKGNPQFPGAIDYLIDEHKISGTDQGQEFEFNWDLFHGYRDVAPGLMFYLKPSSFFFIPKEALPLETKRGIIDILRTAQVSDLALKKTKTLSTQKLPE